MKCVKRFSTGRMPILSLPYLTGARPGGTHDSSLSRALIAPPARPTGAASSSLVEATPTDIKNVGKNELLTPAQDACPIFRQATFSPTAGVCHISTGVGVS